MRRAGDSVPDDFPRFVVPGHEREMSLLRKLYWLHDQPAGPLIPLWDEWMPMSTLWPARGEGLQLNSMRGRWAAALAGRAMNAEGFVHTHQHDGPAHAEGWPFPLWQQAGGIGWHFAPTGVPGYDAPHATPDGWTLTAARGQALSAKGWPIELTAAGATAQTPSFAVEARAAPWLRLNWWASGLERANPYVEWTAKDAPQFSPDRRLYFSAAGGDGPVDLARGETRSMLPMYRLPAWKGAITGLRIGFDNPGPAQVVIKSFHTACDTRQNINNSNFIRGCHDYFLWTSDLTFLRGQIGRIRTAMRFMMREFDTRARKCVYTTWPGHEGRSGVRRVAGKTVIVTGEGIGSNYFWGWSNPESVPWGNQVQDGGAVLGFSYHDLMARLKTAGPDDAWQRLRAILAWFDEVQLAGGYRQYYKDPSRGTMQGGNVPGGLGLDKEFFESILVPQVMLYGFLGLRPTADGFSVAPRLPADWKELSITRIHLRDHVIDVRVTAGTIEVTDYTPGGRPLKITHPPERKLAVVQRGRP